MSVWKPIIVGVDGSKESIHAALTAWEIAGKAATSCYLVHGTGEVEDIPLMLSVDVALAELQEHITAKTRQRLEEALRGQVPPALLDQLEVRLGKPAWAIAQAVGQHDASLLVLGGKRHTAPVRWFGGSASHHIVRRVDVPVLVTRGDYAPGEFKRIVAAVDLSHAARPTLEFAAQLAELFNARLTAVHVIEPVALLEDLPAPVLHTDYAAVSEREFRDIVSRILDPTVEHETRVGSVEPVLADLAIEWDADLLVVGSHGKGWVDRVIIGSTTERLLNKLPTSLLVVPVGKPHRVKRRGTKQNATTTGRS